MRKISRYRGPYIRPDGRKFMVVIYEDGGKSTTTYARYLAITELNLNLNKKEVVHHKDEIKTNDELSNLEVKTRVKHSRDHNPPKMLSHQCPICKTIFERKATKFKARQINKGCSGPYCSKSCASYAGK